MLERLANAFKREEQLTADVSHALRTPLTIAQGEATLALRGERSPEEYRRTIEIISQEIAHLTSITNRLLFLARADHNQKLDLVEIGLAKLLDELVADLEVIAEDKHISLRLDSSENLAVKGDPQRIRELFTSLIDNAIRFTPAGGNINVSVRKLGAYAVIAVSDTGIGIAEELLEHIFERLYRVNTQNLKDHGAGLGLAISKRIVEMHKGKIEVISTMGKGSTFSVFLPVIDK
jgi:signal transduction histidine kinase